MPVKVLERRIGATIKQRGHLPTIAPDVSHSVAFLEERPEKGWPGLWTVKTKADGDRGEEVVAKRHCEATMEGAGPTE